MKKVEKTLSLYLFDTWNVKRPYNENGQGTNVSTEIPTLLNAA